MGKVIVDGNYTAIRAICSSGTLASSTGEFTGGIYKMLRMLYKFKSMGDLVVVFDGGHAEFRKILLPEYKQRAKPDILTEAEMKEKRERDYQFRFTFDTLDEMLPKLGIPTIRILGQEADDVIYRLAEHFVHDENRMVYAVSDDADYLQFVNIAERVGVYQPIKELMIRRENFEEVAGCSRERFVLHKALCGDKSDNINGVHGVGKVKAAKALLEIQTLMDEEGLTEFQALKRFTETGKKSKMKENIARNFGLVKRNVKLMDINQTPLTREEAYIAYKTARNDAKIDEEYVYSTFKRFEFTSLGNWLTDISLASKP